MAASERARELVERHKAAWFHRGLYTAQKRVSETAEAEAALLAYVAALEACVAAAREASVAFPRGISHAAIYRNSKLRDALAALDRPEGRETT